MCKHRLVLSRPHDPRLKTSAYIRFFCNRCDTHFVFDRSAIHLVVMGFLAYDRKFRKMKWLNG